MTGSSNKLPIKISRAGLYGVIETGGDFVTNDNNTYDHDTDENNTDDNDTDDNNSDDNDTDDNDNDDN
jgi:hypothetical protein